MDPDHATTDDDRNKDARQRHSHNCLARRLDLTYSAEIEGINDTLHIAEQWVKTLDSMATYFDTFKQDFAVSVTLEYPSSGELESDGHPAARSLRDGGPGEGDEEYELFRHRLYDYSK